MDRLEQRILEFSKDTENHLKTLALIKVGRDKGDSAEQVMVRVIFDLLMRFHGIPIKPQDKN